MANNLSKISKPTQTKHFTVVLPFKAAENYIGQAGVLEVDTEEVMSKRLVDCQDHNADKPLFFNDDQRRELERILDYNFSNATQVLNRLRALFTVVKISDMESIEEIVLDQQLLYRLAERANMSKVSIPEKAKEIALDLIKREVGIY